MGKKECIMNAVAVVILLSAIVFGAINNIKKSDKIVEACHANVELQICE